VLRRIDALMFWAAGGFLAATLYNPRLIVVALAIVIVYFFFIRGITYILK
jgi:hypothetical protein